MPLRFMLSQAPGQQEQQAGMGGIIKVKEPFPAPALLPVVPEHQRQGQDNHPLDGEPAVQRLGAELVGAENQIHRRQGFPAVPEEIQGQP